MLAAALVLAPARCTPNQTPIFTIQGRAHVSPLIGREVRSSGVVTAVAGPDAYVQDPEGDGDPATSDAVVIRSRRQGLRAGDEVRFRGRVAETVPGGPRTANLSTTTIEAAEVEVLSRGRPLPAPVILDRENRLPPAAHVISPDELPVNLRDERQAARNRYDPDEDAIDFFESLEGMLVTLRRPVAISALQAFDARQSEVVTLPDSGAGIASRRRTPAGGILLQSGRENLGSQNPERVQIQFDAAFYPRAVPSIRVGDRLSEVSGILRYDFGNYELAATSALRVEPTDRPRPSGTLVGTGDRVTVATYNVLNLSATPADSAQRRMLAGQIVESLRSPDILALQEVQDESGEADDGTTSARGTLRALTSTIRRAGGPTYAAFDVAPADGRPGGAPGGNIRNAFIYNPARVRLISYRSLTPEVLGTVGARDSLAFRESRDPLEGVFEFRGRRIGLINNHLSSRFGSTPTFGAVQPFVQAGEAERAAQVRALRIYAAHRLRADPDARLIVLGDMNTFEFSDELAELLPGSPPLLYALSSLLPPGERYTYNYEGNSQTLDHVFVSASLREGAELEIVHLNTDFPALRGLTASDHDPQVARLRP